jgi:L-arabinose 1-dehydrogenase [NAD(P)+]
VTGWETETVDVTVYDPLVEAVDGHDCVVHLAAESASEARWESVRQPNVEGTWNLYRVAAETGVDRVVFASSNHVTHMYNVVDPAEPRSQTPRERVVTRPSGRPHPAERTYGVTKVAGEAIGTYHADHHGVSVVNLRIGWVLTQSALSDQQETDRAAYARAIWLIRSVVSHFRNSPNRPANHR